VDGNKRTSLVVTALFLSLNGCELIAGDADLYRTWMRLAEDASFSEEDLATWLRQAIAEEK
jgi:death-on-curing protein